MVARLIATAVSWRHSSVAPPHHPQNGADSHIACDQVFGSHLDPRSTVNSAFFTVALACLNFSLRSGRPELWIGGQTGVGVRVPTLLYLCSPMPPYQRVDTALADYRRCPFDPRLFNFNKTLI